jgi:hypothetical protein
MQQSLDFLFLSNHSSQKMPFIVVYRWTKIGLNERFPSEDFPRKNSPQLPLDSP